MKRHHTSLDHLMMVSYILTLAPVIAAGWVLYKVLNK